MLTYLEKVGIDRLILTYVGELDYGAITALLSKFYDRDHRGLFIKVNLDGRKHLFHVFLQWDERSHPVR